jgi:hypothetical protein
MLALTGNAYLAEPGAHAVRGRVAVVGGGAIAVRLRDHGARATAPRASR